jgi:putative ABC transport system permease protein
MNLATARSSERAREVGMRKALGAGRGQLAGQFLSEAVLMSAFALVLALIACEVALPSLNQLAGKTMSTDVLYSGPQILVLVGLVLAVGLVAGSYPALVLSRFRPVDVMKRAVVGSHGDRLRKALVVFQFTVSIALIAGTGIVLHQLGYLTSAGLGFEADNLLVVEQMGYLGDQRLAFEQEAAQIAGVEHIASGFSVPGSFFINSMWQSTEPGSEAHNLDYSFVDPGYVEALGIEMAAGRSFSREYRTDSSAVMLSEAAALDFGWTPDEAVGKQITQGARDLTVVGVMEPFHYRSLHAEIYPLALFMPQRSIRYSAIRISPENQVATLTALRSTWERFSDLPFAFSFLADNLAAQYAAEQRMSRIFTLFSALAIVIACLGLFGLAAFTAERRTKEIGIRKVLGATTGGLVALLSRDFARLVLLAFIVATPIAWYAMDRWLDDFAYRIAIPWSAFAIAGIVALGVALLTVGYHATRAAVVDPVNSLRYE